MQSTPAPAHSPAPPRRNFERRLRRALILFAVVPSLVLLAGATYLVSRAVALGDNAANWERVAESGSELIRRAEASGDPALAASARAHRDELGDSVTNARRWDFLIRRVLALLPVAGIVLGAVLALLAMRASRRMGRRLSRPLNELAEWAGRVARGEPLPAAGPDEARSGEFAVVRDSFRHMQHELALSRARELEAERMRTWVGMARRVAHELKNPLTPMRLAVRTLERSGVQGAGASEALEVISDESERLEEMARAFAQFGRLPEGPPSDVDVCELLESLLRTHLPPEVPSALVAPEDCPSVHGHYDALSRAFANLLLNAGEAVDGRGGVRVEVAVVDDDFVEVAVLDEGPGIDPENLDRIWEADFTTKSRGTGLGLALVRQTVQAHGGQVVARNRDGGGAEFRVTLPIARQLADVGV